MEITYISPSSARASYDRFLKYLSSKGKTVTGTPIVQQADLRLEKLLTATSPVLKFDLQKSTGNGDRPMEVKLSSSEIFFVHGISIAIQKQNAGGGNQANRPMFTYPDKNYFIAAPGANSESAALEAVFQGLLSLRTDGNTRIEDLLTHHMKFVPDHQFEPTGVTGQATGAELPSYGGSFEDRGYLELTPNPIIDGNQTNELQIQLGDADLTNIAGGADVNGVASENVIVVLLHGWCYKGNTSSGAQGICSAL